MALCLDGFAGNGQRRLVGFIMANIATGLAYLSIPILLYKFVKNRKKEYLIGCSYALCFLSFLRHYAFCRRYYILVPLYRLNAVVLSMTALISWILFCAFTVFFQKHCNIDRPQICS
jgi:hypothetical protein